VNRHDRRAADTKTRPPAPVPRHARIAARHIALVDSQGRERGTLVKAQAKPKPQPQPKERGH
jgi:hypothetical protein